jgi:CMP-N-acetylneuraminic acid synthetase
MPASPTCVALIPARSGSKRVADKNVRRLGEHPVMGYAIQAALASGVFGKVIVSTDSEAYAEIARHYGAEVPGLRPAEYASSTSPDIEWIVYTLKLLRERGEAYDCFSILRPTSPFRLADTIRRAWDEFRGETGVDSLRAVEKVKQHPGKMWAIRGRRMTPLLPLVREDGTPWHSSQMASLPEFYIQNASLEIAWSRVALEGNTIAGTVVMPFITSAIEGFDINDMEDWWYAQHLLAEGQAQLPEVSVAPFGATAA